MTDDVLQRALAALEALDTDALVPCYADDAVFEDASSGQTFQGPEELRSMFRTLFGLPDVRFSDVVVYGGEGWGAAEWVWSGTRRGTGTPYRVKGASIFELRGDRIVRETIYYDPRPALPEGSPTEDDD